MSQQMLDWWAAHPEKREEMSQRMLDWWAAHPEKREEMSQRMLDWWAAHPEKREQMSQRMLALEAACAPGSCSYLHANPEWHARFREASSKRWVDDFDYRVKMQDLLRRERPKMKAIMSLKWQDDAFRSMMLSTHHRNLEARREKDLRNTSALVFRFERGEMTGPEKQEVLRLRENREKGRRSRNTQQSCPTHAASDALAAMIDSYYDAHPEEKVSDARLVAESPETTEARRGLADKEKLRREQMREHPRAVNETRSSGARKGWAATAPEQKLARTSHGLGAVSRMHLDADKACEGKMPSDLSPAERLEFVSQYNARLLARKKRSTEICTTPHTDALAEAILSWWAESPLRKKDDQMAKRREGPIEEAKSQLDSFHRGDLAAGERWKIKIRGDGRLYQRKKTGGTSQDPKEVAEIYELVLAFYARNPGAEQGDRSEFERSKKRILEEKSTGRPSSSSIASP